MSERSERRNARPPREGDILLLGALASFVLMVISFIVWALGADRFGIVGIVALMLAGSLSWSARRANQRDDQRDDRHER